MVVEPFTTAVMKEILSEYHPKYTKEDLLALWTFTGGVAKYIELLIDSKSYTKDSMIKTIVKANSVFLDEGKAVLVEEFDKEYGVYFSILSAIARGLTERNQIEQTVGRQIGGYLARLESDYALIRKHQPLFAKPSSKAVHYELHDNFLIFWFRYLYRYSYILEIKGLEQLRAIIARDYPVLSGHALEDYFRRKEAESGRWTRIGSWWNRKGENEIDLIAENELDKYAVVAEVKRDKERISVDVLKDKVAAFLRATGEFNDYSMSYLALSLEEM